ncbi:MAG: GNAT family N-acetyltransferase [Oscillatoria sp. PMC 1068.18]|nr:GNAT family N-acetyltransferase [Oscillatoria sp. PMC 1076.18]MEC4991015.1 GNAT family N-acetyltransferase [Oscillatoria sp. PMC 1068.18]
MEFIFLPIDSSVRRDNFDCGVPALNDYLKKYARQNHVKNVAKTFVAIVDAESRQVVGYYSLSMGQIEFTSLPEQYRKGLPRYPLPAMRIGKLAVDLSMQGRGLGKALLVKCFLSAVSLSSEIGIFAITVDAINEQANEFYLKYGFVSLEGEAFSLFIPIRTVKSVIE